MDLQEGRNLCRGVWKGWVTPPQHCCPSLDTFQPLNVLLSCDGPKTKPGLEVTKYCPAQAWSGHVATLWLVPARCHRPLAHLGTPGLLFSHHNQHLQVFFQLPARPRSLQGAVVTQGQDPNPASMKLIPQALAHQSGLS